MVVANAVAGLAEISQTCGRDLLELDKGNIPKLLAALNECLSVSAGQWQWEDVGRRKREEGRGW